MSRCYNIVICSTLQKKTAPCHWNMKGTTVTSTYKARMPLETFFDKSDGLYRDVSRLFSPTLHIPLCRLIVISQIRFRLVRVGGRLWIHYDRESISNPIYSVTSSPSYRSTTSQACPESLLLNQYLRISTDEEHPSTVPRGQISKMENKT